MIGPLSSLSPTQRRSLLHNSAQSAPSAQAAPLDAAEFKPHKGYRDPDQAISFMGDFNTLLGLSPEMTAEKNQLMSESSHAFFRATPALFSHDLKTTYSGLSHLLPREAPSVAVLGDAHVLNAGTFRGPEGKTVWGLNDFDQAEFGSPEFDLERLGVSLYVAARSAGESSDDSLRLVEKMARSYLDSLGQEGPSFLTQGEAGGEIAKLIEKAGSKDQDKFLDKWTTDGRKKLKRDDTLVEPEAARGWEVRQALQKTFPELTFLDMASKPHSGGSTRGLERYYSLVTSKDREEAWILESKVVLPSPVQVPDGDLSRGDGEKVLHFQRQMGGQVDQRHRAFQLGDRAFFTREREREKDSLKEKPDELRDSAVALGRLLARAHGKSGADLKGWVGSDQDELVKNLCHFSKTYARQVESDFRAWSKRYPATNLTAH